MKSTMTKKIKNNHKFSSCHNTIKFIKKRNDNSTYSFCVNQMYQYAWCAQF